MINTRLSKLHELTFCGIDNPRVSIILCNVQRLPYKKIKTEYEQWLLSISKEAIKTKEPQTKIRENVFYSLGYDDKYVNECARRYRRVKNSGVYYAKDCSSKYVNCIAGCRVTTDLPENSSNTVYIFGHSIAFSSGADDANTISSHLQRFLNQENSGYSVMNCANSSSNLIMQIPPRLKAIYYRPGDVIVIVGNFSKEIFERKCPRLYYCDVSPYFVVAYDNCEIFWDKTHTNSEGYKRYAKAIFDTIMNNSLLIAKCDITIKAETSTSVKDTLAFGGKSLTLKSEIMHEEIVQYIEQIKKNHVPIDGVTGAIVMNCNPFTLGHRYLIEYAASKVKRLYIFVVEENKSNFPFEERMELVKLGTADIDNVVVIPSGRFIISSLTFPAYFSKSEIQEQIIDPSQDVTIFAEKIAPALNISVRFAGEEPIDNITRQYNMVMRMILPRYNIQFESIPRKTWDGLPISASRVRELLKSNNFEEIAKLVPNTTLKYLKK